LPFLSPFLLPWISFIHSSLQELLCRCCMDKSHISPLIEDQSSLTFFKISGFCPFNKPIRRLSVSFSHLYQLSFGLYKWLTGDSALRTHFNHLLTNDWLIE
jgi:hypothetical protein